MTAVCQARPPGGPADAVRARRASARSPLTASVSWWSGAGRATGAVRRPCSQSSRSASPTTELRRGRARAADPGRHRHRGKPGIGVQVQGSPPLASAVDTAIPPPVSATTRPTSPGCSLARPDRGHDRPLRFSSNTTRSTTVCSTPSRRRHAFANRPLLPVLSCPAARQPERRQGTGCAASQQLGAPTEASEEREQRARPPVAAGAGLMRTVPT
jgi:hypothetical protein